MHDPLTVAFEIRYPWKKYGKHGRTEFDRTYRAPFITIWHRDPEKDGSDDSCGWFKRARHGNQETLKNIRATFAQEWDAKHGGWFNADGAPRYSVTAITLNLFWQAAWEHFDRDRQQATRFVKRHLFDILFFAENPVDSLHPSITGMYGFGRRDDRIDQMASVVYGWILHAERMWWQHPRWHIHHWRFQVHPCQQLRRRFWDRCCKCGKRGFPKGVSAIGDWSGKRLWHSTCDAR